MRAWHYGPAPDQPYSLLASGFQAGWTGPAACPAATLAAQATPACTPAPDADQQSNRACAHAPVALEGEVLGLQVVLHVVHSHPPLNAADEVPRLWEGCGRGGGCTARGGGRGKAGTQESRRRRSKSSAAPASEARGLASRVTKQRVHQTGTPLRIALPDECSRAAHLVWEAGDAARLVLERRLQRLVHRARVAQVEHLGQGQEST